MEEESPAAEKPSLPGMAPTDETLGNLPDIAAAGSYYNFLLKLHKTYGDLASFWYCKQQMVSVASPQLFQITSKAFDRPDQMFEIFSPLMDRNSLAFANGDEGKARRRAYDRVYSHAAMTSYVHGLQNGVNTLLDDWSHLAVKSNIPLNEYTYDTAMRSILLECFGDFFNDATLISKMKQNFDFCWRDLEQRAGGVYPEPGSPRDIEFNTRRDEIYDVTRQMLAHRRQHPPLNGKKLFVDVCIEYGGENEALIEADCVDFIIGGYMSTGDLLTWCLYYLAMNPDVQQRLLDEAERVLGKTGDVDGSNLTKLTYMKNVLDETLRVSLLGTFLIRHFDQPIVLQDHLIPTKTPIIQAIGVTHMDERYWPNPEIFDPDRFSPEVSQTRPKYAFVPFGFGGGRKCPGFRFTYLQLSILVISLLRRYRMALSPGQGTPARFHGLLTYLEGEIYIDLTDREQECDEINKPTKHERTDGSPMRCVRTDGSADTEDRKTEGANNMTNLMNGEITDFFTSSNGINTK